MDKQKRKIPAYRTGRIQKKGKHYSETERHAIICEMLKNKWKQYAWAGCVKEDFQVRLCVQERRTCPVGGRKPTRVKVQAL